MRVVDFFKCFALVGQEELAGIPHSDFEFHLDGWAAAVALARDGTTLVGTSKYSQVCKILVKKQIKPEEWAIEALAISHAASDNGFSQYLLESIGVYWPAACQTQARSVCSSLILPLGFVAKVACANNSRPISQRALVVPEEFAFSRRYKDRDGREHASIVNHRKPLVLPYPSDKVLVFARTQQGDVIPRSALFYASRFYRLRQVAEKSQEAEHVAEGLNSVLLSMVLYYAALKVKPPSVELNFEFDSWRYAHKVGTEYGGEIFGMEGLRLNLEFFEHFQDHGEAYFKDAAKWWIPELSDEDQKKRELLLDVAMEMVHKLGSILNRSKIAKHYPQFAPNPFQVTPRAPGAFKEELEDRLKRQREARRQRREAETSSSPTTGSASNTREGEGKRRK
ncbi:uncharacterized protein JCM6883_007188 [Sporobolomyces salmoneus]|uniref:uncharacterized protein n=1 Tax=Sporobolomyces salmoneus TaxID=183962 RepID=UPI003170DC1A